MIQEFNRLSVKILIAVSIMANVSTARSETLTFDTTPKWAGVGVPIPEWIGAASALWNTITDYEGAQWYMGVSEYTFNGTTTYNGCTTAVNKRSWLDSNGGPYWDTTTIDCANQSTSNSQPFPYAYERRTYSCSVPYGNPPLTMGNTTTTATKFWIRHTVTHWPGSSANFSPATGSVDIQWTYDTLTSGCSGTTTTGNVTYTSASYIKNDINLNAVSVPVNNSEVTQMIAGKRNL